MGIAAVCLWSVTALFGLFLLGTWLARGGIHRVQGVSGRHRRLPRSLVLGHPTVAAVGLIVWIWYLVAAQGPLVWAAFGLLVPAAVLGAVMFIRWVPTYRARTGLGTGPGAAHRVTASHRAPPEQHFPVLVVLAHGVFAVATVVLVLLTALNVG
jgi:hypothetical protein